MLKRLFDLIFSIVGITILSPIFLICILAIWLQDFHSPFYIAKRVGKDDKDFYMIKLRSMIIDADKTGVDSTSSDDNRITGIGKFIRRFKIDELSQLINVLLGDMSFVGPRPNVRAEIDQYTNLERNLLSFKPGITDFSSIVFSDEGDILEGSEDPDLLYNQIIRPWKSRLALVYVKNSNLLLDIKIIFLTILSIVNKERALKTIKNILIKLGASDKVIEISQRKIDLEPYPPPGSQKIVNDRI
tara:strand:- start:2927 stop:3658 length:732 start_codon:yes stop_codon:yes gene_type:complete